MNPILAISPINCPSVFSCDLLITSHRYTPLVTVSTVHAPWSLCLEFKLFVRVSGFLAKENSENIHLLVECFELVPNYY